MDRQIMVDRIPESDRSLPIGELQLSKRTHFALEQAGITTVGQLFAVTDEQLSNVEQFGPVIAEAVRLGRQAYMNQSAETEQLSESARSLPLGHLHLPLRTHNALKRAGINTVGQMFDLTDEQLSAIRQMGPANIAAVQQAKQRFLEQLASMGELPTAGISRKPDIQVIPSFAGESTKAGDIIAAFPNLVDELLSTQNDERPRIIIKRRYGLDGSERLTLEQLGSAYGLTRERVRQLESRALKLLRGNLLEGTTGGKDFRLHPLVREALQPIADFIEHMPGPVMLESALIERIETTNDIDTAAIRPSLYLLFDLLELRRIDLNREGLEPLWGCLTGAEAKALAKRIRQIDSLFTEKTVLPLSEVDILIQLNQRRRKNQHLNIAQLRQLLPLCTSVEPCENAAYWARFENIRGRPNQVERVLFEQGESMHFADIAREINRRLVAAGKSPVTPRNLINQISGDERFTTIGKSGEWGLSSWSMETSTVLELMRQFLTIHNEAATAEEIYSYVNSRRPVRKSSIESYLTFKKEFVKLSRTMWGLVHWAEAADAQIWNVEQVGQFIEDLFRKNRTKKLEYAILRDALMEAANVNPRTARGMLNSNPVIKTKRDGNGTFQSVFQPDYRQLLVESGAGFKRKQLTLLEQVHNRVRRILDDTPDNSIALARLVQQLVKEFERPDKTFYQYISRLDYVEKYVEPETGALMCRLKQESIVLQFPAADTIQSENRRLSVGRALSFLTKDDVDIALFLLSKEFEAALNSYLTASISKGMYPDFSTDRLSLDRMINFIKKEGVITDQAILSYLRQKRNERAHGRMPTIEERQILMKSSEYTAGLYIDYIKFFDDLERGLT